MDTPLDKFGQAGPLAKGIFAGEAQASNAPSIKAIIGFLLLVAFTVFITWRAHLLELTLQSESDSSALVGQTAPNFSASTPAGGTVSLSDFHGQKNVVVAFWASWCGPCRLEMPALMKFYQRNHKDSSDFEILAVSIDEDAQDAADFASAQKVSFPVLLDPQGKMASAYQVNSIPTLFVIDKNGKIIYGRSGYDSLLEFRLATELRINQAAPDGRGE